MLVLFMLVLESSPSYFFPNPPPYLHLLKKFQFTTFPSPPLSPLQSLLSMLELSTNSNISHLLILSFQSIFTLYQLPDEMRNATRFDLEKRNNTIQMYLRDGEYKKHLFDM